MKSIGIVCLSVIGTLLIAAVLITTLENAGYVAYEYNSDGDLNEPEKLVPAEMDQDEDGSGDGFEIEQEASDSYVSSKGVEINILTPRPGSGVGCPFAVTGIAPSNWAFEGQLPVSLKNSAGEIIMITQANLRGEWTSSEPGLFVAALDCPDGGCVGEGVVVVHKDNPSALPENDDSAEFPIVFGESCN